jgi:hypothetical protein
MEWSSYNKDEAGHLLFAKMFGEAAVEEGANAASAPAKELDVLSPQKNQDEGQNSQYEDQTRKYAGSGTRQIGILRP